MPAKEQLLISFIHRLKSPLANIGALIGLLQSALADADPDVKEWLQALGISADRLAEEITLLSRHTTPLEDGLRIDIPAALITEERVVMQHMPAARITIQPEDARSFIPTKVLIIEDSPLFRAYLGKYLREAGFEIVEADDGEVGLDLARQHKPDLIILDYVLPMVHGQQLAHVLHDDPETRDIPLIVCTATERENLDLDPHVRVVEKSPNLQEIYKLAEELLAARRRPRQPQILVIDDDQSLRPLLVAALQSEGYHVIEATTGEDGIAHAQQQEVDLVLLDLLLPDMDGFEVLRQLRRSSGSQMTPIILLSVVDTPSQKVQGFVLGGDDYVTKPFVLEELQARIRAALRRHQLESSANPSTMLPGNVAIDRALGARIATGEPFAIGYADLDNFKAYNDTYGFLKGDAIIRQTARLLTSTVERHGAPGDFVGHIGGDDFVFMTTPELVPQICTALIVEFDRIAPLYYDAETRGRGYIDQADRQGKLNRYPLVSISIGVVTNVNRSIAHPAEISDIAAELKKYAKRKSGSTYVIDRRRSSTGPLTHEEANFKLPGDDG
jgi:DNA-binding response OmpR family regulator